MTQNQLQEIICSFVETQQSYEGDLAPEGIYVLDETLANELGVSHAPYCGVFTADGGDVSCLAAAGPDGLGHWNGVDFKGRVREFLFDEMVSGDEIG